MCLKCTPHLFLPLDKREHKLQSKPKVVFSHSPTKYPEYNSLYESQLPTIGRRIELHTQAWKEPGPLVRALIREMRTLQPPEGA